jgi:hypothetical protein
MYEKVFLLLLLLLQYCNTEHMVDDFKNFGANITAFSPPER